MLTAGSSPLARGTRRDHGVHAFRFRFIPARAGNTALAAVGCATDPVHPRSRGEHFFPLGCEPRSLGSSPLARGTLHLLTDAMSCCRFIPARAGNTA